MENSKLKLDQTKLSNALKRLEEVIKDPIDAHKAIVDATIQRFEFTFELFWKWLRRIICERGIEVNFPKDVLREAYKAKMIDDEEIWLKMLRDRNLTSHTYNEDLAMSIYKDIKIYAPLIREVFERHRE